MKRPIILIMALAALLESSTAFALFDAQLLVGRRWYSQEVNDEKVGQAVQTITAAGHLGLIPIVSFGLSVSVLDVEERDRGTADTYSGLEVGLDILAEIPLIPIITPYGRVNLPVYSKWAAKGKQETAAGEVDVAATYSHGSGYLLMVGAEYSPIPLLGIHLEVGKGYTMVKLDEYKVDDNDGATGSAKDAKAADIDTIMLGVSIGL